MPDWSPELYLKFKEERTRPVRDLIARLVPNSPARVIDIGCGPGNSTLELKKRFPDAELTGLDSSPAMIAKARAALPGVSFVLGDAALGLSGLGLFDIVFSNAAIHWIRDQKKLLENLCGLLVPGGILAVQVPQTDRLPAREEIAKVSFSEKWKQYFKDFDDGAYYHDEGFYYDILSGIMSGTELWVTEYCHVLENHAAIIDWMSSTALRPYLDRLPEGLREGFCGDLLRGLESRYRPQADGRVLFPFRRVFFTAVK